MQIVAVRGSNAKYEAVQAHSLTAFALARPAHPAQ